MVQYLKFYFSAILLFALVQQNFSVHRAQRSQDRVSRISDEVTLQRLNQVVSDDTYLKEALHHINVPRVVGTANHTEVAGFITQELKNLGWYVEADNFMDSTPLGVKSFINIIATSNKNAAKYLDLACHFDSKLYRDFAFYGTTDSAVPCAMMLHIAKSLNPYLRKSNGDLALRLIFFDGEEAFVSWTDKDSLYGARHLAQKWASTPYPEAGRGYNQLHKMELLVLLDLLGAPNPRFYSFFSESLDSYKILVNAQSKLNQHGFIQPSAKYFHKKSSIDAIQDDHIPFLRRGVPVLHIIPTPFPRQWHTQYDNADAIDMRTINNLTKILSAFVVEYLDLDL